MEQSIKSKNDIDKKELLTLITNSHNTLQFMADTSDTFNDFFSVQKEPTKFYPAEIMASTLALLNDTFNKYQIIVTHTSDNQVVLNGSQNEFSNIMLSILNNAKEVFVKRETYSPNIIISMEKSEGNLLVIIISDNAGGIVQKPINSIFSYGISSGHDNKSNGLGLFIAKELIQNKFSGNIYAKNTKHGAEFKITIPI
ncbi:MAG: HAMP domain-containing histidine kinase [Colwellia sp.]|nr:HAMP domain-containing histidine kinase [Colwellia sp.]